MLGIALNLTLHSVVIFEGTHFCRFPALGLIGVPCWLTLITVEYSASTAVSAEWANPPYSILYHQTSIRYVLCSLEQCVGDCETEKE